MIDYRSIDIPHNSRIGYCYKDWCLIPSGLKYNSMLISEFIQQLQDLCDNEGDMEIVIVTGNNELGSIPHVKKSPLYDQFEITKY